VVRIRIAVDSGLPNAAHNLRVRPPRKRRAGAPLADRVKQGEPREAPKQAA